MGRRSVIIPNTEKIPQAEVMTKDLLYNESHALGVIEFSNTYNLGITYESLGLSYLNYCSEKWYQEVARLGHVFLRLEEDLNIIYLPSVISQNQYDWFDENKEKLESELVNFGLQVVDEFGNILLSESPKYSSTHDKIMFRMLYIILEEQITRNKRTSSR